MENFAIYKSPLGYYKISYGANYLTGLKNISIDNISYHGKKNSFTEKVYGQLLEYFFGQRRLFNIPIKITGTDFQLKVWKALQEIPYGQTWTYKDVATYIDSPKSYRAVGRANNKNPIEIIIPCHRVIGSSGKLVGYSGGLDIKRKLLEIEGIKIPEK